LRKRLIFVTRLGSSVRFRGSAVTIGRRYAAVAGRGEPAGIGRAAQARMFILVPSLPGELGVLDAPPVPRFKRGCFFAKHVPEPTLVPGRDFRQPVQLLPGG
jgi:hypothetical protein